MSGGFSATRWFTDQFAIGTKIATGFAVVLAILAVSSVAAWLSFGRVSIAIDDYAKLVANSANFRDIDLTVTRYRGQVREYVYSNNEEIAASAVKTATALNDLVATSLSRVVHPERHRLLEEIAKLSDSYTASFRHVADMNHEQEKLQCRRTCSILPVSR